MKLFRVLCCSSVLLLAGAAVAADLTLPELFKRAKDEFAAGSYQRSLTDFDLLDSTSAKPGFESDRAKFLPVVTSGGNGDLGDYTGKSKFVPGGTAPPPKHSDTDNLEQDYNRGSRESWIYRKERLPKGIAFQELRVSFVTKQGYGTAVLQKDPQPMQALGFAAEAARRDKQLN
jgi:hypothetical protein